MVPSLMSLFWLAVVVLAIPLALWLLKRSGYGMSGMRSVPRASRVIAQTVIAPQQRIVTVEVGEGAQRCWLVVGVTPQQMTVLHRLDPADPAEPQAASRETSGAATFLATPSAAQPSLPSIAGSSFGQLLSQWRRGSQGPAVSRHEA